MKIRTAFTGLFLCSAAYAAPDAGALTFTPEALPLPPLSLKELIEQGALAPKPLPFSSANSLRATSPVARVAPAKPAQGTMPIVEPNPNVDYKMVIVPPNPNVDFKMAVVVPGGSPPAKK